MATKQNSKSAATGTDDIDTIDGEQVTHTMSASNGDEKENMNPGVRFANALSAALLDIETHAAIQAHTYAELARARKAKNSALLNAAQAKWTVDNLTNGHDAVHVTQVLTALGNMPTDAATSVTHSPAEILATRLWVIDQVITDIESEYANDVIRDAKELLYTVGYSPILSEDKRDSVIANTVRAAKTGTMPRGKAAQNKESK